MACLGGVACLGGGACLIVPCYVFGRRGLKSTYLSIDVYGLCGQLLPPCGYVQLLQLRISGIALTLCGCVDIIYGKIRNIISCKGLLKVSKVLEGK